jgi:hypothetical protein
MPDHESSQVRSAQSARSYEGIEHPAKPSNVTFHLSREDCASSSSLCSRYARGSVVRPQTRDRNDVAVIKEVAVRAIGYGLLAVLFSHELSPMH